MNSEELDKKVAAEASTTDCPSCGGDMIYDPVKKLLACSFCGSTKEVSFDHDQVVELDISLMKEMSFDWDMATKVIECKNCGGKTVAEATDETAYCVFCGSQHMVIHEDEDAGMRPQGLIPYALSYGQARTQMEKWVKKRWLAPKDLKERFRGKDLKGIYMPYWTYDAFGRSDFTCRIGEYYYVGSGEKRERRTRWHHHAGTESKQFDDVLVPGISSEEARLMKKIEPFNTSTGSVVNFSPDFMAGYMAKKYTILPDMGYKLAVETMDNMLEQEAKRSLPGDTYDSFRQTTNYRHVTFKHILLPVYRSAYAYNDKVYQVLINGQTGEVQGHAPLSKVKVAGLVVLGLFIGAVVLYFSNR